jgi:hypothetical protein
LWSFESSRSRLGDKSAVRTQLLVP